MRIERNVWRMPLWNSSTVFTRRCDQDTECHQIDFTKDIGDVYSSGVYTNTHTHSIQYVSLQCQTHSLFKHNVRYCDVVIRARTYSINYRNSWPPPSVLSLQFVRVSVQATPLPSDNTTAMTFASRVCDVNYFRLQAAPPQPFRGFESQFGVHTHTHTCANCRE